MSNWASEWADAVRDFQKTFGPYFPVLRKNREEAGSQLHWLEERVFGNPIETVRRRNARMELAKLRSAFLTLAQSRSAHVLLMRANPVDAENRRHSEAAQTRELLDVLNVVRHWHLSGELEAVLALLKRSALSAIESTPETGNARWDSIDAVDALLVIWRRNGGKAPPRRDLRPGTALERYLGAGLEFLDIEASPVSAFRAWRKKLGKMSIDPAEES